MKRLTSISWRALNFQCKLHSRTNISLFHVTRTGSSGRLRDTWLRWTRQTLRHPSIHSSLRSVEHSFKRGWQQIDLTSPRAFWPPKIFSQFSFSFIGRKTVNFQRGMKTSTSPRTGINRIKLGYRLLIGTHRPWAVVTRFFFAEMTVTQVNSRFLKGVVLRWKFHHPYLTEKNWLHTENSINWRHPTPLSSSSAQHHCVVVR